MLSTLGRRNEFNHRSSGVDRQCAESLSISSSVRIGTNLFIPFRKKLSPVLQVFIPLQRTMKLTSISASTRFAILASSPTRSEPDALPHHRGG